MIVVEVQELLKCSNTTVWTNLSQLKRMGIVVSGDQRVKRMPTRLTVIGKLIVEGLRERRDET